MEMISVQSSQIAQIGHDGQSTLRILFRRGGLYEYGNVSPDEFGELRSAESIGSFFAQHIKGAKPYTRMQGSEFPVKPARTINSAMPQISTQETEPQPPAAESENQEVEQVERKASLLVQNANSIKVIDPTTQAQASQVLLAIAALRKEVADTFRPMKEAAFRAHRVICEQEKKHDEPLAQAERAVNAQISAFVSEQRRIAKEAEDEARAVEKERAEREAQEEADRRALEDAEALQDMGDTVGAEAVLSHPAPAPVHYVAPAPVAPAIAQVKGLTARSSWDFRIVDETRIPREYLLVNESAIRAIGKRTYGKAKITGVEFYETTSMVRTGRG